VVSEDTLEEYVGQPHFRSDRLYADTPPGVVMGLAWTSMGGSVLYIELVKAMGGQPGKGALQVTGQLGNVMSESATIAHTFARGFHAILTGASHSEFFATTDLHLHVPAGATPKDGPSAGCTIVTAMLSLATGQPVRPNLAMTGEVSLTGRVLQIGGVKEKTLAAQRNGVKTIIFPAANRPDWEELSDEVKQGLDVHFAETYVDIYKIAFPDSQYPLP